VNGITAYFENVLAAYTLRRNSVSLSCSRRNKKKGTKFWLLGHYSRQKKLFLDQRIWFIIRKEEHIRSLLQKISNQSNQSFFHMMTILQIDSSVEEFRVVPH
jgi:hypothetical protein